MYEDPPPIVVIEVNPPEVDVNPEAGAEGDPSGNGGHG